MIIPGDFKGLRIFIIKFTNKMAKPISYYKGCVKQNWTFKSCDILPNKLLKQLKRNVIHTDKIKRDRLLIKLINNFRGARRGK